MKNIVLNNKLIVILLLGLGLRIGLLRYGLVGDINAFAEWGDKFWELGAKQFYNYDKWYFSRPTYPPLANLYFAALRKIYEYNYILPQIHNKFKIIPPDLMIFIGKRVPLDVYYFTYGYYSLIKLPVVLADVGTFVLVYKIIKEVTKKSNLAITGAGLFFLNPVSILLTSVWGQTEGLVTLLGLSSFYLLNKQKFITSVVIMMLCLSMKPTWMLMTPLYLFLLINSTKHWKKILFGFVLSFLIYYGFVYIFNSNNTLLYAIEMLRDLLPSSKGVARATVSAFNFHSIFLTIDKSFDSARYLVLPARWAGYLMVSYLYVIVYKRIKKAKVINLKEMIFLMTVVGIGSYLFGTNMLERYFYAGFVPLIIIGVIYRQYLKNILVINGIFFLNLLWSFFRRDVHELDSVFTNYNYLFIRILSIILVIGFIRLINLYIYSRDRSI